MKRQAAFLTQGKKLKGALHVHTTRSDGAGDPAAVIRRHGELGYDFMALTDHNIYNYQNFAPEVPITILPGMERDHRLSAQGVHCFHTVVLGPEKDQGNGYDQDQRFEGGTLIDDQFAYQPVLDDFHAHGNLTMYCHPQWSATPAREFEHLHGNFAMEIWNSGCVLENDLDGDAAYWDELLMAGKRIWGTATDDGHPMHHHGHGWVRVAADNNVTSILQALKEGAFYASCGPEIYDFYIDGGQAVLECSPCAYIGFRYGRLPTRLVQDPAGNATRATFEVPPTCTYLRAVVKDSQGRKAWTNPIFL